MALVCFPEGDGDLIREELYLGPVDRLGGLVVIAPARRAGDPGLNLGPGENFSLKLLIYDLPDIYTCVCVCVNVVKKCEFLFFSNNIYLVIDIYIFPFKVIAFRNYTLMPAIFPILEALLINVSLIQF